MLLQAHSSGKIFLRSYNRALYSKSQHAFAYSLIRTYASRKSKRKKNEHQWLSIAKEREKKTFSRWRLINTWNSLRKQSLIHGDFVSGATAEIIYRRYTHQTRENLLYTVCAEGEMYAKLLNCTCSFPHCWSKSYKPLETATSLAPFFSFYFVGLMFLYKRKLWLIFLNQFIRERERRWRPFIVRFLTIFQELLLLSKYCLCVDSNEIDFIFLSWLRKMSFHNTVVSLNLMSPSALKHTLPIA